MCRTKLVTEYNSSHRPGLRLWVVDISVGADTMREHQVRPYLKSPGNLNPNPQAGYMPTPETNARHMHTRLGHIWEV